MPTFFSKSGETIVFNYCNQEHLALLEEKSRRFTQALGTLQWADGKLAIWAALVVISWLQGWTTSAIFGSIGGTSTGVQREPLYKEFREAFIDLWEAFIDSMGPNTGYHWQKLAIPAIQTMITTLGPWVSGKSLKTWPDDALKPTLFCLGSRRKDIPQAFQNQLEDFVAGKQEANWAFRLYGEKDMNDFIRSVRQRVQSEVTHVALGLLQPR